MLVYFEPAAMCDLNQLDLLLAPLPARKQLWEACDEVIWKTESDRITGDAQTAFGLATNGDLVRFDESWLYNGIVPVPEARGRDWKIPSRSTAKWEEWCSGMDGLGSLVVLAASLVA